MCAPSPTPPAGPTTSSFTRPSSTPLRTRYTPHGPRSRPPGSRQSISSRRKRTRSSCRIGNWPTSMFCAPWHRRDSEVLTRAQDHGPRVRVPNPRLRAAECARCVGAHAAALCVRGGVLRGCPGQMACWHVQLCGLPPVQRHAYWLATGGVLPLALPYLHVSSLRIIQHSVSMLTGIQR